MKNRDRDERWEAWVKRVRLGAGLRQPPAATLRRALALGARLRPAPSMAVQLMTLVFDSTLQPLPAGVRGTTGDQRRMLYRGRTAAGSEVQLDLRLRRESADTIELTAQLLPPWIGARFDARIGPARRRGLLLDSGEFIVQRLPDKSATLRLEIAGARGETMVIEDVPLPDRKAGRS